MLQAKKGFCVRRCVVKCWTGSGGESRSRGLSKFQVYSFTKEIVKQGNLFGCSKSYYDSSMIFQINLYLLPLSFFFMLMKQWTYLFPIICCVSQIDENVKREIINHRSLRHPNIIRFKEVGIFLYLYIFMFRGGIIVFRENVL